MSDELPVRELALRVRASDDVDLETLISTLIERHKPEHVLEFVSYIITGSAQKVNLKYYIYWLVGNVFSPADGPPQNGQRH